MGAVWRRPSLTLREVAWRWLIGTPMLVLVAWKTIEVITNANLDANALQAMTVFQPVAAFATMHGAVAGLAPALKPLAQWLLLLSLLWIVAASFGRTWVLRHLDPSLHARPLTLLALDALRAALLTAAWSLWGAGILWAAKFAITGPARSGREPNLVLFCGIVICGTLALYVLWGAVSWVLQMAPLLAMLRGIGAWASIRETLRSGAVRGKLVETNLVMNIVRIALIVLAMVFSACPLPFTSVETPTFLACWWCGVALLYLVALDYFHVVRSAVYLALWRAFDET
jgi:hypothetical protein